MERAEPNPNLERVRFELRATGVPLEPPNPLQSGLHTRGYLPHVKREGASYFVTFRLADSLPKEVLLRFLGERASRLRALEMQMQHPKLQARTANHLDTVEEIERDYRRKVERYLDKGAGACYLARPEIARMISSALQFFEGKQYALDDWVIMPNHIHMILWPTPNFTLSEILKSRKQFTATQANRMLKRVGEIFWQPESFDHWIRDDAEKSRIRAYVRNNPVKAGLCANPEDWRWSSAWHGPSNP